LRGVRAAVIRFVRAGGPARVDVLLARTVRVTSRLALTDPLPIFGIRADFLAAVRQGPVVLSSPTGSGKSTEVPRWCQGKVLVVEPRRIACRSLAVRVAELEGTELGGGVGYLVRDERVSSGDTRILFATPGMVLRDKSLLQQATTVILDEFHERSLDVDLLLALLKREVRSSLVVMSATLDAERVAAYVNGVHLTAEGRAFPVDIRYLSDPVGARPDVNELPGRIKQVLIEAARDAGDVLAFLPGKAEIEACLRMLSGSSFTLLPLHGGLSLAEQRRAFEPAPRRKLILATNVAETSLTIPGIGVVIDAGLARQTRYQAGRGFLALVPIAEDSAAQRAGRAGRTAPGVCYRLWSARAQLEKTTLPEMHRESLVPLVLGAAAWGTTPEELTWLDAPKPYALEAARGDLAAWGALDAAGALSEQGRGLFGLPLDPLHARLLVSARSAGCLEDMIDLVAALSVGRPLFLSGRQGDATDDDFRASGCDVSAVLRAVRSHAADDPRCSGFVLGEARAARARLRRLSGLPATPPGAHVDAKIDRDAIVRAAISADPRLVYVARTRGRQTYFSNGGTEIELARESALQNQRALEALLALDTRAFGTGREARVLVTCGMAIALSTIARAGLGRDQIATVQLVRGRVVSSIERVYAKRVIAVREETPSGALLREALATLLERGSLFREAVDKSRERLARTALASALAARGHTAGVVSEAKAAGLRDWLLARLDTLGVEHAEDLELLSAQDFLAPELTPEAQATLERDFPAVVNVGDAIYRTEYDLERRQVLLQLVKGNRREPPPLAYLPRFAGFRVCVSGPRGIAVLRER
jgi:ATP-dependent helicase HrpB